MIAAAPAAESAGMNAVMKASAAAAMSVSGRQSSKHVAESAGPKGHLRGSKGHLKGSRGHQVRYHIIIHTCVDCRVTPAKQRDAAQFNSIQFNSGLFIG